MAGRGPKLVFGLSGIACLATWSTITRSNDPVQGIQMNDEGDVSRDRLVEIFGRFDTNGDGLIGEAEFGEMLEDLDWDSSVEVRALEFAAIDSDADGLVGFEEFADWWLDRN